MTFVDETQRLMAIDPGAKRIGIAISDVSGTIARPLSVIKQHSRKLNAEKIAKIAQQYGIKKIIVGQSLDENGNPTSSGKSAEYLAQELKSICRCKILLIDEEGTTKLAQQTYFELGSSRKKRKGHHDDLAASILLQSYIDTCILAANKD